MSTIRKLYIALSFAFLMIGTQAHADYLLTRHVHDSVTNHQVIPLKSMLASKQLRLDIVLPLRNQSELDALLQELYNPSSPSFKQFLTVQEFTEKFAPSEEDYNAAVLFLTQNGFNVVGGTRGGMDVQVESSVRTIEKTFHISMKLYQHPEENRIFYSPDREPSVELPFPLWHISGLDNYSIPKPLYQHKPSNLQATSNATTGSGPGQSFLGSDMRAAYYGAGALNGTNQTLGLLEYYGTDLADLTTYYTNVGQVNHVPITLLSTDGTPTTCIYPECDDTEQTLDMTQALGIAPNLSHLVMFIGSTDTAILSSMTTHSPLPTTIGCSWGWTPADPNTLNPYWQRMQAQGQTFFAASGDSSTWSVNNNSWPADSPYVVSVGGTDLATQSAGGSWTSETAWSASGGGISPNGILIPTWQKQPGVINSRNGGSTVYRNGPDVSANANWSFYVCANQTACTANEYGGTSFAAPMWAGYIALANQQAIATSKPLLGFINPSLYNIGVSTSYSNNFHDITIGQSGSYRAVVGYDLVTGWGSMNGATLINSLISPAPPPLMNFSLSATPIQVPIHRGSSGRVIITSTVSGGFNAPVVLSTSSLPTSVTSRFSPTSITGTGQSTLTLNISKYTRLGTYAITVIGTGGGKTNSTSFTLNVLS